jgi:hypothetical protein
VRRLPEGGPSLEVVRIRSGSAETETGCQLELRQDFHTLFWTRRGSVRQVIDGMLLADPAAQQRIAQSQHEIARGEGLTLDQVEQSLTERFGKR